MDKMGRTEKYYQLLLKIISNNRDRSREIYYLVLGYVGNSK